MNHTIRLYQNPSKQAILLLGSLGFVAIGLVLIHDPRNAVTGYVAVAFFGLCAATFLAMIARDLIRRRPLVQVDAQGWTCNQPLGGKSEHVAWQDIGRITLRRQSMARSRMFYLVLEARHPEALPPSRLRAAAAAIYPTLTTTLMSIPLNQAFVRTTPAKLERTVHTIQTEFAGELYHYGITIDDTIRNL